MSVALIKSCLKLLPLKNIANGQLKEILRTKMYDKFWDEEKNMAAY